MKTFYSLIKKTSGWRMKSFLLLVTACFFNSLINAQLSPGAPANFGIDGDIRSDYRLSGSFSAAGTHDWFKNTTGTGIGLIDITNSASVTSSLAAGNNLAFSKGMSVPSFSVQSSKLMLDARYGRDYFGLDKSDSTSFKGSMTNVMNPATWETEPTGASVLDKNDLIDVYVHMRRDGTVINGASSSHLIATMGAATVANNGNRFIDIEFYRDSILYNKTTGLFTNVGNATTGGHPAWTFNADGTVNQPGDVMIGFSYTGSGIDEINVFLWVSYSTYSTRNPAGFDFVSGGFNGNGGSPEYGYAKITGNPSTTIPAWGTVNNAATTGPAWGTLNKSLGDIANNYYHNSYAAGQFGEAAIDLTALGIDPALYSSSNPCSSPFKRVMFKTRTSSSFNSIISDFAGPYDFWKVPVSSSAIGSIGLLTCSNPSVVLQPQNYADGVYYNWTTVGGSIPGSSTLPTQTITQPGKYYLTTAPYVGCTTATDSIIVNQDIHKPVASITQTSILYTPNTNYDSVTLLGGNLAASNYTTPYSSFQGLLWSWTGSHGLNATTQNVIVSDSGYQRLIVTNISNGCKDTAGWYLMDLARPPLSVNLVSFTVALNNSKADLQWSTTSEKNASHFVIEKSFDGKDFSDIGTVTANGTTLNKSNYNFQDNTGSYSGVIYYRLRQVELSGKTEYSETRIVRTVKQSLNAVTVLLYPNPATDEVRVTIPNNWQNKKVVYELYNASGQIAKRMETANSSQTERLDIMSLAPGFYIMRVSCDGVVAQQKVIKN
jgi:hypothetical protein